MAVDSCCVPSLPGRCPLSLGPDAPARSASIACVAHGDGHGARIEAGRFAHRRLDCRTHCCCRRSGRAPLAGQVVRRCWRWRRCLDSAGRCRCGPVGLPPAHADTANRSSPCNDPHTDFEGEGALPCSRASKVPAVLFFPELSASLFGGCGSCARVVVICGRRLAAVSVLVVSANLKLCGGGGGGAGLWHRSATSTL